MLSLSPFLLVGAAQRERSENTESLLEAARVKRGDRHDTAPEPPHIPKGTPHNTEVRMRLRALMEEK